MSDPASTAATRAEHDLPGAIIELERWLTAAPADAPDRQDALMQATILHALHENYERALARGLEAIPALDQHRADQLSARFLHALGRAYAIVGMFEPAMRYVQRARELASAIGDDVTEASVYLTLSLIYSHLGQTQQMEQVLRAAVAMPSFEQLPPGLRSDLLHDVAETAHSEGQLERAREVMERALALKSDSWNLSTYATILLAQGDSAGARATLERALAQLAPHERQPEYIVRSNLGDLLIQLGEREAGMAQLEAAVAITEIDPVQQLPLLAQLASAAAERGDHQRAYALERQRYERLESRIAQEAQLRQQVFDTELRVELAQRERSALQERTAVLEQALAEQQRLLDLIGELSTPLLPISAGVLVLPVIGTLDGRRVQEMVGEVLGEVERQRARALILDITGVPLVDTQVAAAILSLARAVALLGCRCVLVGIRPEIAQTLVGLGVNLAELTTCATIAQGLAAIGLRIGAAAEVGGEWGGAPTTRPTARPA